MNQWSRWSLTAIVASSLTISAAQADTIQRKSGGRRLSGEVIAVSKTEITVKPQTGDAIVIPANDIASITWDDAPPDLSVAISDENGGRLESALARLAKSQEAAKAGSANIKTDIEFLIARVTARQALVDAAKRDEAIQKLTAFQKAASDSFRYYEAIGYLGQVQLAKGDYAAARAAFDILAQSPWKEFKLAATISTARILSAEGKPDEAVKLYDEVITTAGSDPAEQARKYEAMVGRARGLAAQSNFAEALTSLEEVTNKGPADDSALQAEAYVLEGACLQGLNRTKEAILAYLHVDVLFAKESAMHAESLYQLSRLWRLVQHDDRALDAQAKLVASYPNSEWAKKANGGQ
ncbi:MAG TPA: tetratricopeptide repeat protein [Planctomycetaceae bacterium]|nr:tetratricopeptide repeat protein [Planctomycetaceae bacterium]